MVYYCFILGPGEVVSLNSTRLGGDFNCQNGFCDGHHDTHNTLENRLLLTVCYNLLNYWRDTGCIMYKVCNNLMDWLFRLSRLISCVHICHDIFSGVKNIPKTAHVLGLYLQSSHPMSKTQLRNPRVILKHMELTQARGSIQSVVHDYKPYYKELWRTLVCAFVLTNIGIKLVEMTQNMKKW